MDFKTQLELYFTGILNFANKAKIRELLVKLGYIIPTDDVITAKMCMDAYQIYGAEFGKPFAKIARQAVESPKMDVVKEIAEKNSRLSYADGDKLTEQQKVDAALGFFNIFSKYIEKGVQVADSAMNREANEKYARAALLNAQQLQQKQKDKSTILYIGIAGGALLLVIAIVAIVASKK